MALKVKEEAPDFTLPSTGGEKLALSDLKGSALILYFYPKDFTSVCTKQACSFRDQFAELRDLEIPVFGISRDSLDTHRRFKEMHNLPFELLSDEDGSVTKAYKATVPLVGMPKRVTYLLDKEHRIAAVHDELLGSDAHVREMLAAMQGS